MDINDLHPPDDYAHRFFIWHEWLQANGPLSADNAFEYFATSMFYDKQSNNQVLRMQTIHTGLPLRNEPDELRRFTGLEFALVHAEPPSLFIIHKRERLSPDQVRPLAAYFIINSRIYQSPDLYTVLSNRLLTSLYALQGSLDVLRARRPDYTPRTGFVWPIVDPAAPPDARPRVAGRADSTAVSTPAPTPAPASSAPAPASAPAPSSTLTPSSSAPAPTPAPDAPRRHQNSALLLNAMAATAAHSSTAFTSSAFARAPTPAPPDPAPPAARASATPAPAPTPRPAPPEPVPVRAPPGAGKKKRKRTSLAAPPTA